ncbi:hypothetical protein UK23_21050 [Lentzea aerocolonigenes]|uniref:Streptomyces killer toxin-like beta/gamma crystallin domain-containing protein n=2 Tax=Lentzea aerocolonigenes TaxID=68170 RepID=A0A0F0GZ37_LENAE|nr:hypothetical protein UK23_21050 [Lentzea aerocolonigenes]
MVIAGVAAIAATLGVVAPAFAAEQIDCSAGSAAVKIHWTDASGAQQINCYGGAGALHVGLPRSSSVEAGRNSGWVEVADPVGATTRRFFGPGEVVATGYQTLTKIYVG